MKTIEEFAAEWKIDYRYAFYDGATKSAWIEADRAKALVEALEFCLHAAEYLFKPDKELPKGLGAIFYHTLTYEGDLELINKTKLARQALEKYRESK